MPQPDRKLKRQFGDSDDDVEVGAEGVRYQIMLPEDDYDDDDEQEERVALAQRRNKQRVVRGNFRGV
jgi:hypothetical protein